MRALFISIIFVFNSFAIDTLAPTFFLKATGDVQDIVYEKDILYGATSEGVVDIFDIKQKKQIDQIKIPDIKDFIGDSVPSKLYSVDKLNDKLLIVSQGMKGYRNLWIYKNKNLEKKIDISKKLFIKKARFINDNKIILATLSNQIIYYDLSSQKKLYTVQISPSSFSDFTLNEDKTKIITTDESGIVRIVDVNNGNIIKEFESKNLDRVYQLDYKNNIILTAGQDRRMVIYKNNKSKYLDFDFLLYSCGLSPSGNLGAVAYNEENDILVVDTSSLDKLYKLTKNKATLTKILFINENSLFSTSDSEKINFYKLK